MIFSGAGDSRSVLSSRLAALVEIGIMERREYREDRQRARIEYPLTEMGQALGLPFMAMTEWSDRWIGDGSSPLTCDQGRRAKNCPSPWSTSEASRHARTTLKK